MAYFRNMQVYVKVMAAPPHLVKKTNVVFVFFCVCPKGLHACQWTPFVFLGFFCWFARWLCDSGPCKMCDCGVCVGLPFQYNSKSVVVIHEDYKLQSPNCT